MKISRSRHLAVKEQTRYEGGDLRTEEIGVDGIVANVAD